MTGSFNFGGWISYGLLGLLATALVIAAGTDIRRRQIDNWLNAGIALAAPLFWWGCGLDGHAIALQLLTAGITLGIMWAMFALRLMGGGDVKLLAALALWIRPLWFLRLIWLMALIGGALSLGFAIWHLLRRRKQQVSVPYGVAISGAGLWVLGQQYLPFMQTGTGG